MSEPAANAEGAKAGEGDSSPTLRRLWRGAVGGGLGVVAVTLFVLLVGLAASAGVACFSGVPDGGRGLLDFVLRTLLWGGLMATYLAILGAVGNAIVGGLAARLRRRGEIAGPEPEIPGRSWRAWARRLLGVAAATAVVAFLAGAYLGHEVESRWRTLAAEADAVDPGWRLDRLLADREPVPVADNGAIVAAQAAAGLPDDWPPAEDRRLQDAFEILSDLPVKERLDVEDAAVIDAELQKLAGALAIARRLADYDRGRTDPAIGLDVFETPLPHLQSTRGVARLLKYDAAMRAHRGDADGAIASCLAVLGAARSIGDEPMLISQLVRSAIDAAAEAAVRRALGQGEAGDAVLARLQDALLREARHPFIEQGERGERAMLMEFVVRMGDGRMRGTSTEEGFRVIPDPWFKLWMDHQAAVTLEHMNELIAIPTAPPSEHLRDLAAWAPAFFRRVGPGRLGRALATIPFHMTPAVDKAALAMHQRRASLGALAIVVAIERQRLKTGAWPESIDAIDPAILPQPPLDPFTGEPYRMLRDEGRIRVYAVGPNGEDDDGDDVPDLWSSGGPDDAGAEVWDVDLRGLPLEAGEPPASATGAAENDAGGDRS
ncbi:hypothetical protein [Paludisphaera soli]|uniref:hypothetical protein n=1 Tax=Paludisphaera soli TaxID=2712865 RepID=UPI0013EBA231|nr:hypothetical protein [Paludisphaera soli]